MNKLLRKKLNKKGFTLIELIIVIAILGILAVILIPRFTGMRENANVRAVEANLRNLQSAVEVYVAENNKDVETINSEGEGNVKGELEAILGSWPQGPGEKTTYSVSEGKAQADVDGSIAWPSGEGALSKKVQYGPKGIEDRPEEDIPS